MAEAMVYDSLVTDIIAYAEREDDTAFALQVPRFIMLAENRLIFDNSIKGIGTLRAVTLTVNSSIVEKPARWRANASWTITVSSEKKHLKPRGYAYCREYWPNASSTDEPLFYSDYDIDHWLVVPTPGSSYSSELMYYERPEPLDSTNQSNWFTQYAPNLILYASLLEAQPFLKNSNRIQEFQMMYQMAVDALAGESKMRVTDNSTTRSHK